MRWLKKQNIKKLLVSLFLVIVLSQGISFSPFYSFDVFAQEVAESSAGDDDKCSVVNIFCIGAKWILYAVLIVMQVIASAALVLFQFVIQPSNISGPGGLLNIQATLELWQFIRDFFNLFFILILLFSAFATIFQVEQYSLKKLFLSILLGALLVNFSFPITRFLVDMTNVPMYYFVNTLSPNGSVDGASKTALGEVLSASQLTKIIIPDDQKARDTSFKALLLGIVFMFIFAISVVVLSVMLFIRVIGLVLLLIFSPVGFAASFMPGLSKYSSQWWEKFWSYALFGPSAALMLLVAVKFMSAVKISGTMSAELQKTAVNIATDSSGAGIMTAMVMFLLPIILIWMAIGSANKFSIAGAGAVTGMGEKFAKWGGNQALRGGKWVGYKNPIARGVGGGVKKRLSNTWMGKFITSPSKSEAALKGYFSKATVRTGKGLAGAKTELQKLKWKEINEKAKENKENRVNRSALIAGLDPTKNDEITRAANALSLAEAKEIKSAEVLQQAMAAAGDNLDLADKVLDGARSEAFDGMNKDIYAAILASPALTKRDQDNKIVMVNGKPAVDAESDVYKALNDKMKKEGKLDARIAYEIDQFTPTLGKDAARNKAYDSLLKGLKADDLAAQSNMHQSTLGGGEDSKALRAYLEGRFNEDSQYMQEMLKKMSLKDREVWIGGKSRVTEKSGEQVTPAGIIIPQGNYSKRS